MVRTPFLWGIVMILCIALAVQGGMWRNLREEKNSLSPKAAPPATQAYQRLATQIANSRKKLEPLERSTLWGTPHQIVPILAKITSRIPSIQLVGVEELPPKLRSGYQSFPQRLKFSGDYRGFSELLTVVEGIQPAVRIDEVRIYERQRYPETLWMSLTVAPMQREDADDRATEIEIPPRSPVEVRRNPFEFWKDNDAAPRTIVQSDATAPELPLPMLTGILWNEQKPIAVFTDHRRRSRLAHVDEVVAGATVTEIQPQYVVLKRDGIEHQLSLLEERTNITSDDFSRAPEPATPRKPAVNQGRTNPTRTTPNQR
ncbi:MAG: hypothetical protein O7E52_28775 [Candidatus Poribacteria bacterium]|nr:hypothetical protein [Candidatus Poribacteria bacterium]